MYVAEDVYLNDQSTHVLTDFLYQKMKCRRPGGVRQQFKAVLPMVESILQGLKGTPELQGPLQASIWDQGDAVGAWLGDKLVAVVFPTPETLPQVSDSPLHFPGTHSQRAVTVCAVSLVMLMIYVHVESFENCMHSAWDGNDDVCSSGGHESLPHNTYTAMHYYFLCQLDKYVSEQLALSDLLLADRLYTY